MVMIYILISQPPSSISLGTLKLWSMESQSLYLLAAFWISVCLVTRLLGAWILHSIKIIYILLLLLMACKLFDTPFQTIFLRYVCSIACCSSEVGVFNIVRDWNKYVDIISYRFLLIIGFDLNQKSNFCFSRLLNNYINSEERLNFDI